MGLTLKGAAICALFSFPSRKSVSQPLHVIIGVFNGKATNMTTQAFFGQSSTRRLPAQNPKSRSAEPNDSLARCHQLQTISEGET
jgi:hypothetical protein